MLQMGHDQRSTGDNPTRQWVRNIGIAAAVGLVYFLVARLSQGLLREPYRVAAFSWLPAGISSGAMIALDPRARWFVAAGVMVANALANLTTHVSVQETFVYAAGNTAEPLVVSLLALGVATGTIVSVPRGVWENIPPSALLLPILLWISVRCRPFFAAAGAFLVCFNIAWMTVFGVGRFGDSALTVHERIEQAQANMLIIAISALVLAALFAERRENEARLAHSNTLLERERENKLMKVQAVISAIAHETRQPLAAITANASAARRWLERIPPDQGEARAALDEITNEGYRISEMFDGIRALFGKGTQGSDSVDLNLIILSVLKSLEGQLNQHGVMVRRELASELPLIAGHSAQLREVIFNLVNNALEAMQVTTNRSRVLHVKTECRDRKAIAVSIRDSGPGIDSGKLAGIFAAFVTTKAHGTGLGLALCRMIVEQHGGRLTATSDGQSGALFQFVLPIDVDRRPE
jgi:signal transduction histidine kinase